MNQVSSKVIANYFINKSFNDGVSVTPMKILKLVYIAHGWHLGITDNPLIDEAAQAWQYGPVVPSLYQDLKDYGRNNIDRLITHHETSMLEDPQSNLLDRIWSVYKNFNGLQLSTLTHEAGTPWYIVYHERGGKQNNSTPIPNDLIREHYKQKIASNKQVAQHA